jgi:hypothetical protein
VLVLWHAFLFLGLRFFPPFFFFCLVASTAFSCKKFSSSLYLRAVLMLWHAFLILIPRAQVFSLFFFLLGGLHFFF